MKKSVYKPALFLASALIIISAAVSAQEASKEYNKEFMVSGKTALTLDNRYGDIIVETSQTDKVVINVKVTVKYPNQEKANKYISFIDVQFSEEGDEIKAKTLIDDKFSFTGWGGESRRFRIDYHVNMPKAMDLTLYNRYGDTELDDLSGMVDLDIKYGNISTGRLTRGNEKPLSELNISYGKGVIQEAGWLDLTLRYSNSFTLSKCQALLLDSKYSNLYLGNISSIVGESRYDNKFRVESINNMVMDQGYSNIDIGTLSKKLVLDAGYGSFNAENVPAGFESIEADSRYASLRFAINSAASYSLDAKLSYGGLKYNEENFQNKRRIVEHSSQEISGIVGKDDSPVSRVKIEASYATVKLY